MSLETLHNCLVSTHMKRLDLLNRLSTLEQKGLVVYSRRDMEKIFPEDDEKSLEKSLQRMCQDNLLVRAARGIYVFGPAVPRHRGWLIEQIAQALRPGDFNYVSLESILSEYGVISQIPVDRLTVMTTGAKGLHKTPFGAIEFTHTKRRIPNLLDRTLVVKGRPLRIARKRVAIQDLHRVGRNTDLIDWDEMSDE
ncbi:type IV toxin-antitoxin system AbiEi family antitoxin [Acidithiobacillus sp. M4-SHS-6]|uniref:type IV toxin-antitoxin system AbiEi family antitoxin n=1 Tax=Acidithiobacillus sp. M4-SHS-6 TaxID=3383024 RepID=UPI0039BDFCA8